MIEFLKRQLISILLASAIVVSVLSIYTNSIIIAWIVVISSNFVIFCFLEFVRKDDNKGLLYYLAILVLLIIAFAFSIDFGKELTYFIRELKYSYVSKMHFLVVYAWACFGASSVIFYFTSVLHKFVAPFLLLFIPSILYTTHELEMPIIYSALMISLFFSNIIQCRKNLFVKDSKYISSSSHNFSLFASVFLMFIIAFIAPKPKETPFNIIEMFENDLVSSINLTNYYQSSGGNIRQNEKSIKTLLEIKSDGPLYLKRQVFNNYNGVSWLRPTEPYLTEVRQDFEKYAKDMNVRVFIDLIKNGSEIDKDFAQKHNIDINNLPSIGTKIKTIEVTHVNFPTTYIPHPLGIVEINGLPKDFEYYRNPLGEIITTNRVFENQKYSISYIDVPIDFKTLEFLKKLDHDKYSAILNDLKNIFLSQKNVKYYDISNLFLEELEKADQYKSLNSYKTPESIKNLAKDIVEGKTSDHEKALAIENYFHQNKYIYDLKYEAPPTKKTSEYFIFESKTGTCSDYATAMTLMARSVGLNVRYVEGFLANQEEGGIYTVTTKNSHAYPEIFLYGYGWKIFEPTVASVDSNTEILKSKMTNFLAIPIALIVLLFLVNKYIFPILKEILFRKKLKSIVEETGVILIYSKILKMAVQNQPSVSYTPQILTEYIFKNYNIDIKIIAELFEEIAFNDATISKDEFYSIFIIYENFYKLYFSKKNKIKKHCPN